LIAGLKNVTLPFVLRSKRSIVDALKKDKSINKKSLKQSDFQQKV